VGAWGEKPFENDSALDWLNDLRSGGVATLRETLSTVATSSKDDYLDVDDGSFAIAAAEIVAASLGQGRDRLNGDARSWLDTNAGALVAADVALARRAVERVVGSNSELRGLWDEAGNDSVWHADVRQLLVRLGSNIDAATAAMSSGKEAGEGDPSAASIERDKQVLVTFLSARGLEPTAEQAARIQWSRDPPEVRRWVARALNATSVAAVLDD
jgi:hypothetical protein